MTISQGGIKMPAGDLDSIRFLLLCLGSVTEAHLRVLKCVDYMNSAYCSCRHHAPQLLQGMNCVL